MAAAAKGGALPVAVTMAKAEEILEEMAGAEENLEEDWVAAHNMNHH